MKKNFKSLGKFLSQLFCIGALLGGTACTDDDVTGSGNVSLQVSVTANSPLVSRAIVTDEYLPDGSTIGVSLLAADGSSYDGQSYSNVKYTAAGTGEAQTWTGASDVSLSGNPATVVAYYPWQEDADLTAIPVETATQTDYMWAETLTGVANTNPGVELVMNHALTAVRVKLVLGDYTGSADVSDISVASPALGTAASLDVLSGEGALADITGQGDAVFFDVDFDMTAEGTSTDIMLVPDASVVSGKTVVAATIGGKKFTAAIAFNEAYRQGYVYTYTITLDNKGFELTKVAVTPWQDGGDGLAEFEPLKDDTYIIKVYEDDVFSRNAGPSEYYSFNHNMVGFVGTIDWGDGTIETFDEPTNNPDHTYKNDGTIYTITAKGTIDALYYRNINFTEHIVELVHIGKDCGITSMEEAFYGCDKLVSIKKGALDGCTEVTKFDATFDRCSGLTSIPAGLFDKCTEVTSFDGTFRVCRNLEAIPEGLFDNCTKVTSFGQTFGYCTGLTSIPEGLFDHCTEVTYFGWTFQGCSSLESIPEGLFDYCTEVTDFGTAFEECTSLTSIPEGIFDHCTKVTNFYNTFYGCEAVTGESPYTVIQVDGVDTKVHLYERKNYLEYFTAPTSYTDCFYKCTGLTDYANIPVDWK